MSEEFLCTASCSHYGLTARGMYPAALMYDVVDNPLGVLLETGELQPVGSDVHVVPIRVSIPLGKITLLEPRTRQRRRATSR